MSFLQKVAGFSGNKKKEKYVLSLDVGTRVVKALVSCVDFEKSIVTNLGVGRQEQRIGNIVGGKISDIDGVINTCRKAIEQAKAMAKTDTEEVIMGFSGNTVRIFTSSFEIIRKNPQNKIDSKELRGIIKDVHLRALEEIKRGLTYREKESGIRLVSADIVDFSIDGYRVVNPLNFKGSKIKISISSSYIISSDFGMISSMAEKLGLKLSKIVYGPYAVIKAAGAQNALNFNAVLVDVGGNITDVVIVKNGNIQKAGMYIMGGHMFTKRIANSLNIPEEAAEDVKIKYSKGGLREDEAEKIGKIIYEDMELWLSGIELILEEEADKTLIPSQFLCYGGGSQLPGLANILNCLRRTEIPFSDKFNIDFISLDHIAGNCDKTKKMDNFQDITLVGLAHLCLDSVNAEDTANNLLAEII